MNSQLEPENRQGRTSMVDRVIRSPITWVFGGIVAVIALAMSVDAEDPGGVIQSLGILFGLAVLYFLPSIIARHKPNSGPVFIINLFLGWTLIGWVVGPGYGSE